MNFKDFGRPGCRAASAKFSIKAQLVAADRLAEKLNIAKFGNSFRSLRRLSSARRMNGFPARSNARLRSQIERPINYLSKVIG